ncbi:MULTISPECIES: NAD(P)-dependent alcohol dehydrogenase [Chryseobacterium]|uniref:Zinc-type alcohol dehydrogenase-like protein n=1 Tax=Chryseobacterium camelliae TaxID=1265445 RepID=A0ABU0TI27_9FLAO|nr:MULTISPECIES: NAD(P)-dependent alcohol dehydrogenase [Chryseobacterium]MDT3406300.1 putative zinc-type alcohol dehydrogenase-like protein [Pseudacidovorax intermedius]MDQ1095900.1 putative zinc-type alcohol dehydrogenase-like protein [Chryseobacterium camelliae]MDQ1099838.1 putative zinc-type alcohol dehydrogenase-like protein [Chryseobacterium sp. SORGH_AS_1048]MDR6087183.1 putative zinc-type alcohol dehydrogenase-like protein [Chryseobacterium sp. SORGH_AS_0909]MDR6131557.1 putative zinc-
MEGNNNQNSRRKFIQQTALAGTGLMLINPLQILAKNNQSKYMGKNIKSRGFAGKDESGKLESWNFERRVVGDNDILIEIKFSGICHSDIHTIKGHWGKQPYPQVPGHEIAGIVTAVGKNVTQFKVGDKAGVGCMVNSCMKCESCKNGEEQHCENNETVLTYGTPDKTSPSGITQGGYSNNIVVTEHFAIKIPESIDLKYAAPLLCAGITTYSPMMKVNFKKGDKIGVVGIGGLGHLAVKLAVSKGAEVYAFTTSPSKLNDIKSFGAKEVIVVKSAEDLKPYKGKLDFMISTVPYAYDMSPYIDCVKKYGYFTQVGQPVNGELTINNFNMIFNRVNFNGSLIGGIPETQEVMDYCADNKIYPQIQIIKASEINDAWDRVVNKEARYRYVIDAATF